MTRLTTTLTETIIEICNKLGIKYIKVNPKGTTNSKKHDEIMKKLGLDKHMTNAYLIALRGLKQVNTKTQH